MSPLIALLRGINVGGRNIVKMAPLRAHLVAAGLQNVATYIQSGNIVAHSALAPDAFGALIAEVIEREFGVATWPAVIDAAQITRMLNEAAAFGDLDIAHFFVFREPPSAPLDAAALRASGGAAEDIFVVDGAVVLFAPDGLSKTKFAEKADRLIPVPVTARNSRTLARLRNMALGVAP